MQWLIYICIRVKHKDIGGLDELVRIGKQYSNQRLLAAIAPVMVTVMPSPDELKVHICGVFQNQITSCFLFHSCSHSFLLCNMAYYVLMLHL